MTTGVGQNVWFHIPIWEAPIFREAPNLTLD